MRHTICIYLAIAFFNVPADCLAQSIDSPNQKNVFKTPPKAVRESCGRNSITLNSGQTFKKVKACWSLPKFDRVRIEDKGNVLSVSEAEIKNYQEFGIQTRLLGGIQRSCVVCDRDNSYVALLYDKVREPNVCDEGVTPET